MNKPTKLAIGILIFLAVVLGALIYMKSVKMSAPADVTAPLGTNGTSGTSGQNNTGTSGGNTTTTVVPAGSITENVVTGKPLSEADRKKALNPPQTGSTPAEQQAFFDFIAANARTATYLELGVNCAVNPTIIKLQKGANFNVRNTDKVAHTIVFNATKSITVPAGQMIQTKAEFGEQAGIYGYGCDASGSAVGMVLLTQ